ncbi:TOMM precursor leader peptide-binding protein [Nitrospira sp. Nam80]
MIDEAGKKLYAKAVQLMETFDGVLLKRGCTEVRITGEGVADVLRLILAAANHGATVDGLTQLFIPAHHSIVKHLIQQLTERRLLAYHPDGDVSPTTYESSLDIFYWHFDASSAELLPRLADQPILIMGVNYLSQQLAVALGRSGMTNFSVVDHPQLRNLELFDDAGKQRRDSWPNSLQEPQQFSDAFDKSLEDYSCLVVASDCGRTPIIQEWNKACVQRKKHFLPVVLHNMIGYLGPLVVPTETPCYECLLLRQNSHLASPRVYRAIEESTFEYRKIIAFHPAMAGVLAELAAFELAKFYGGVPHGQIGRLIEVNLLTYQMTARKVLKVPRCPACSPLNTRPSMTSRRTLFASPTEKEMSP